VGSWLRLTDAGRAKLVADYQAGASLRELGKQVDRSPSVIRYALLNAGCELRPMGRRRMPVPDARKMARDYEKRMTLLELVTKYGVKRDTLTRNLREQGVTIRPTGPRR
jgi:hypothetical protein